MSCDYGVAFQRHADYTFMCPPLCTARAKIQSLLRVARQTPDAHCKLPRRSFRGPQARLTKLTPGYRKRNRCASVKERISPLPVLRLRTQITVKLSESISEIPRALA